jgi:hypothetical protein
MLLQLAVQTRTGWTTIGLFRTLVALYEQYRFIRATTELLGAKVLNEDGTVRHVIF